MKSIILVLKNVISPLVLVLFLLLGLIAAFLSGIVEYAVIKEMFTINLVNTGGTANYSKFIPLVIVLVLEGFKLFLHYVIPAHERENPNDDKLIWKKITKYFLVIFSLICTFIFSCNSMYDFNTVSTNTGKAIQNIELKYDAEINKIETEITANKENSLKVYNDEIVSIRNDIDKTSDSIKNLDPMNPNYDNLYSNLNNEKQRLELRLEEKNNEYNNIVQAIDAEIRQRYENRFQELENIKIQEINKVKSEQTIDSSGDNQYIRAAIKFVKMTFFADNSEYKRGTYCLIVALISLLVSIILEVVITVSQAYLSKKSDELAKLFGSEEVVDETIKNKANNILWHLIQAAIMLAVFIIIGTTTEMIPTTDVATVFSTKNILVTFGSYFISVLLTSGKMSIQLKKITSNEGTTTKVVSSVGTFLLSTVVQTLLCIVGFIILCRVTGNPSETIYPSTMALTIGSVSGQLLFSPMEGIKAV